MVHNIFCIDIIKYTKEGFFFSYTSNHSADSNEGCLKTVDIFTCSSIFVSLCSFLAQPLLTAVSSLQSRNLVATCYIAYASPPFTVLYFLGTLIRMLEALFYYWFWLWGRKEKEGWTCTLEMRLPNRNLSAVASLLARHNLSSDCLTSCREKNVN